MLFVRAFFACAMLYSGVALGDQFNWCSAKGKTLEVHLFARSFGSKTQRDEAAEGLDQLLKGLRGGDRLIIFSHGNNGYSKPFDHCYAECKKEGLDALFATDCSAMIAQREQIVFRRGLAAVLRKEFSEVKGDYDIYRGIQSLYDAHKSTNQSASNIYGAISMVPPGVDPQDIKSLNAEFVKATQKKLIPSGFPKVHYIGRMRTEALDRFWSKIFEINGARYEFD
jgi:hypothetical protein